MSISDQPPIRRESTVNTSQSEPPKALPPAAQHSGRKQSLSQDRAAFNKVSWYDISSPKLDWDGIYCHMIQGHIQLIIGHVNNIPTMQFPSGVSRRNTQSKSDMLSLTEYVWDFQNNALWSFVNMPYVIVIFSICIHANMWERILAINFFEFWEA